VLRSFDGVKQSAMHIYHSALSWTPTSSSVRQLYEHELMAETKLVNAVDPTWDACIRIIPMGETMEAVVFSSSGDLIAAHGACCMKVFDAMTGVNRATFDGRTSISSVAFSPDDGFLVFGLLGGTINVWDVQTSTVFQTFKWNSSICPVTFSSCGTMIASGASDGTIRIWNILSGGCDYVFQGHWGTVTDVCWLATWNQVVSASNDLTVRIWDVQKQSCLKIFRYHNLVAALALSRGLLLVAFTSGTVNIYDSQSGDIIHVIRSNNITHSCFSIDGGKVLVANESLGDIWDITTNTLKRVRSITYNGGQATFSPDGTRIASIYGKFVKIWTTNDEASTHVHDTIDSVYISPDQRLVTLKSKMRAEILDATTGRSLFTHPVTGIPSIVFSLDSAFVAFLSPPGTVHTWNAHTRRHKSIVIDHNVFDIALSPDGSQLASLSLAQSLASRSLTSRSPSYMKLWDLKRARCLAQLEFDMPLQAQAQISFTTNATSVSVLQNSGTQSWCISPNHNIDLTKNPIKNSDGTKSWLIVHPNHNTKWIRFSIKNRESTKLPMVFVPTMEEQSNQGAPAPCQSYHCNTDGEWILGQDGRRVLWIPPDERPRKFWCLEHEQSQKTVVVHTESGKVYYVKFLQS
jgi:WD40 repeat protein